MRSWVIGKNAECDVVVDSPLASGRHCQLTQTPEGLTLEDLGSTNGTYVEGNRITAATRITPAQEITLGQTVPMPWPSDLVKFVRIGRVAGNEIVLDDPRVSSRHARLMIVAGSSSADRGPRLIERNIPEFRRRASDAADSPHEFRHRVLRQYGRAGLSTSGRLATSTRTRGGTPVPSGACGAASTARVFALGSWFCRTTSLASGCACSGAAARASDPDRFRPAGCCERHP